MQNSQLKILIYTSHLSGAATFKNMVDDRLRIFTKRLVSQDDSTLHSRDRYYDYMI